MALTVSLEYSEYDIIEACIRQERWAQKYLYEEYYGMLMGVAIRYAGSYEEALDILHDGFIKIFSKLEQYEHGTSLKNWMSRIIVNTAIDQYRKNKKYLLTDLDSIKDLATDTPGPLQNMQEKELLICIQQLPPVYRAVFNLFVVEGYSHKEIGNRLGITESTSRANLVKARTKLRDLLEKLSK